MISAQNKCTSLVCSCYVPSRNSDFKLEEEEEEEEEESNCTSRNRSFAENKNGSELMEEQEREIKNSNNCQEKIVNGSSNCYYNGWSHIGQQQPTSIKSNLKRSTRTTTVVVEDNEQKRKVSWPDAHGKDIALVHEFETSLSEDGELEGVRNSCVCTIQ